MTTAINRTDILQFARYACVGVINTLVTLIVIFVCKSLLEVNMWLSNAIGYAAGMINSFVWNKVWVFHSRDKGVVKEMVKFFVGFIVCYALQLAVTWLIHGLLGDHEWTVATFTISGYGVATLLGMVFYTLCNFLFNRLVTFR